MKNILKNLFSLVLGIFVFTIFAGKVDAAEPIVDYINIKNLGSIVYNGNVPTFNYYNNMELNIDIDNIESIDTKWYYFNEDLVYSLFNSSTFNKKNVYFLYLEVVLKEGVTFKNKTEYGSKSFDGAFKLDGEENTNHSQIYITSDDRTARIYIHFDLRDVMIIDDANIEFIPVVGTRDFDIDLGAMDQGNYTYSAIYKKGPNDTNWYLMDVTENFEDGYYYKISGYKNANVKIVTNNLTPNYEVNTKINGSDTLIKYADPKPIGSIDLISKAFKQNYLAVFDNNGHGVKPDNQVTSIRECIIEPDSLSEEGYIFGGWYTDKELTHRYDFETLVYGDVKLYAKWTKIYTYKFLSGDNQEFNGDIKQFKFTVDGDFNKFSSVVIGGIEFIRDVDYKAESGSTIITFLNKGLEKLNKLARGKHEIKVIYLNENIAIGNVYLKDSINPDTGDNIMSSIIVGIISFITLISSHIILKSKNKKI